MSESKTWTNPNGYMFHACSKCGRPSLGINQDCEECCDRSLEAYAVREEAERARLAKQHPGIAIANIFGGQVDLTPWPDPAERMAQERADDLDRKTREAPKERNVICSSLEFFNLCTWRVGAEGCNKPCGQCPSQRVGEHWSSSRVPVAEKAWPAGTVPAHRHKPAYFQVDTPEEAKRATAAMLGSVTDACPDCEECSPPCDGFAQRPDEMVAVPRGLPRLGGPALDNLATVVDPRLIRAAGETDDEFRKRVAASFGKVNHRASEECTLTSAVHPWADAPTATEIVGDTDTLNRAIKELYNPTYIERPDLSELSCSTDPVPDTYGTDAAALTDALKRWTVGVETEMPACGHEPGHVVRGHCVACSWVKNGASAHEMAKADRDQPELRELQARFDAETKRMMAEHFRALPEITISGTLTI